MRSSTPPATCRASCGTPPSCCATRAATSSSRASRSTPTSPSRRRKGTPSPSSAMLPVDELASDYSNYGPLKALCEQAVEDVFGERALIVRPGLIVGPHDPTGRFTYWAHRLRARRRDPRARPAGAERAVRGRPRSRDLDRRRGRERPLGHLQRDERGRSLERAARRGRGRLGLRRLPARAGGRRVDGAAALARRSRLGRHARRSTSAAQSPRA